MWCSALPTFRRELILASVAALMVVASAFAQHDARFVISPNGSEVTDSRTGLTWRRCSEGQSWTGSACAGSASRFSHEQALARAKSQSGWRLPNVKELTSIVDRTRTSQSIDLMVFPATPNSWFWTATPVDGEFASHVNFNGGYSQTNPRRELYYMRLVR